MGFHPTQPYLSTYLRRFNEKRCLHYVSSSTMKKKSTSQSGFFNLRVLIGLFVFLAGVFVALVGFGAFSNVFAQTKGTRTAPQTNPSNRTQTPSGSPDIVQMVGPVALNQDLRNLPYIPPKEEFDEKPLTRYPHPGTGLPPQTESSSFQWLQSLIKGILRPIPTMPGPLLTFDGTNAAQSGCGCTPPDTNGDVGPSHYVQSVNTSFRVFDKSGNTLAGPTTFNSFFAPLTGTPCQNQNDGDPFVFYDQMADRWVVSDFAFPSFPGTSFFQCIGVSQTGDPVSGGWNLYALQIDPANPNQLGDYPKFALWSDGALQDAYFLTVNLFINNTTFVGVRAFALDRASMISGGPTDAIAFTITPAALGDSYSLVPASFRTGNPPPAGRDEMLLAVDSPASGGVTLNQVKGWKFHVDFGTPANSTLGIGANHTPNAEITVAGFVDAFTNAAGFAIVPQNGTAQRLDTLGDKIMTPMVYQNLGGTESLWASGTVCTDQNCTGPTAVRWYQFDVTGGTFPATPVQQQNWTNGSDGLWRWMPSIAVDANGNTAIGYSTSSPAQDPSIRYAGRLASDPLNDLAQGEAVMIAGGGHDTGPSRWGDYTMTTIDPSDHLLFWHTNEYFAATGSGFTWSTRVGKFQFPTRATPLVKSDFNGDGKADILWQNSSTGQRVIWLMDGTALQSVVNLGTVATSWSIAGSSDFNGDGKADILWQNTSTGQRVIWLMNGTAPQSVVNLGTVATSWSIAGSSDFNGDGKADLVWQNTSTGQRVILLMNGTALQSVVN
ncbi:MAG: hypothetical protein DME99_12390, partial [Verrucomicrobia bacterium]